jgi:uncharacterized protein (DUF2235 family)
MMRRAMAKNIILCSDGTGNADIRGRGTNVFKLFEAVDLNEYRTRPELEAQLAFYDDGVGAKGSMFARVLGNATGYGLASNVKQLYRELSRVYDPGDRIFLFGFSRGAFTVRTLADMIGVCGVLRGELFPTAGELYHAVDAAYDAYRTSYATKLAKGLAKVTARTAGATRVPAFKGRYTPFDEVKITFIGVWDTVDAVGLPFAIADTVNACLYQFKFPDCLLGGHVQHACHALSLDDDRQAFQPVLWTVNPGDTRITQVWFAGVHSNVGGGYPKQGMSLVPLDWMLSHAVQYGLRLQTLDRDLFRGHASVDDMLYDPRAGLGLFYRWAPRDVRRYCRESGLAPSIHLSVVERIAHGTDDYAPGNIPPDAHVAITPPDDVDEGIRAAKQQILERRAAAVQTVIRQAFAGPAHLPSYLLDAVSGAMGVGELSYWIFIGAWASLAGLALALAREAIRHRHLEWHWWILAPLAASAVLFVTAWGASRLADSLISDRFSQFWHPHQPELRSALKQAHKEARDEARAAAPAPSPAVQPF